MISCIRLFKIKRVGNATFGELKAIESYLTWLKLEYEVEFEQYSPFKECHVRKDLLSLYKTTYFSDIWNFEKSAKTLAELPLGSGGYEWLLHNNPEMSFGGTYEITKKEIGDLMSECSKILNSVNAILKIIEKSQELGKESSFGFYDYISDYVYVIQKTFCMLKAVLNETNFDNEMVLYEYSSE